MSVQRSTCKKLTPYLKRLLKCASSHKPLLGLSSRAPGVFRQAGQPGPGLHRACWRAAPPNPFELPASGQAVTFGERKKHLRYGVAMQETLHCTEQEEKPNGKLLYFRSPYRVRMCMITKRSMIKTVMSSCPIIRFLFTTILFWMVAGCCTVTFTAHANTICCAKHRQGLLHCKGTCSRQLHQCRLHDALGGLHTAYIGENHCWRFEAGRLELRLSCPRVSFAQWQRSIFIT